MEQIYDGQGKKIIFNHLNEYIGDINMKKQNSLTEKDKFLSFSVRCSLNILNDDYSYNLIQVNDKRNIIEYNNINLFNYTGQLIKIDEPCTILELYPHYGHFLIDILPRLFYLKKYTSIKKIFFVTLESKEKIKNSEGQLERVKEILNTLKQIFDIEIIDIFKINKIYNFKKVYSVESNPSGQGARSFILNSVYDDINKFFMTDEKVTKNKNIFIGHKNNLDNRIVFSNELKDILIKNNYEIVFLEDLNFKEQVNLFNSINNLICVAGSSLANLFFMNKGANVLAFSNNKSYDGFEWFYMTKYLNIKYKYLYLDPDENNTIIDIFNSLYK